MNILTSNFKKKMIGSTIPGCKTDFERVACASESNREFRKFFDELVNDGCLVFFEKKDVGSFGHPVDTYIINVSNIMKRIRSIEFGKKFYKAVFDHITSLRVG